MAGRRIHNPGEDPGPLEDPGTYAFTAHGYGGRIKHDETLQNQPPQVLVGLAQVEALLAVASAINRVADEMRAQREAAE